MRMGKERIQWLARFAEENVLVSRKLARSFNASTKGEISEANLKRMEQAYRHPFEKFPQSYFDVK